MPIDDPIKAAEEQVASDERQTSPITGYVARLAAEIGINSADKVASFLSGRRAENRDYMLNVLKAEFVRGRNQLAQVSHEHRRFLETDYLELVADGLRKAENLRDRERILRIAKILATAAEAPTVADDVEEMMRIAMELTDADVAVLRVLVLEAEKPRVSGTAPNPFGFSTGPSDENPIEVSGLTREAIQSSCLKLQSFGLALIDTESRWGDAEGLMANYRAFRLLPKGREFIRYVREVTSIG